jgi:hypothetical protein
LTSTVACQVWPGLSPSMFAFARRSGRGKFPYSSLHALHARFWDDAIAELDRRVNTGLAVSVDERFAIFSRTDEGTRDLMLVEARTRPVERGYWTSCYGRQRGWPARSHRI